MSGGGNITYPPIPAPQYDTGRASTYSVAAGMVVSVLIVVALVKLARFILGPDPHRRGQGAGADTDSDETGAVRAVAMVAVEVQAEPVVCAYRRRDGWQEAMCPVCLSDFADGEALRVLPACMHYFHAACVGEWFRANATCPLCRAAPSLPSPAGSPVKATATSMPFSSSSSRLVLLCN